MFDGICSNGTSTCVFLSGSFTPLLRDLVGEFTMADRKGAVTTSLLQQLCHKDDSVLLGSWLQDTDHKDVEEQVIPEELISWILS